jgi:hypothetical protein
MRHGQPRSEPLGRTSHQSPVLVGRRWLRCRYLPNGIPADHCLHGSTAFRVVMFFVLMEWNDQQYKVLLHEHETAERFARVEALRIVAGLDVGSQLIRARLLEAKSRAHIARLVRSREELRVSLGQLLERENFEPALDSVPPLPATEVRQAVKRECSRPSRSATRRANWFVFVTSMPVRRWCSIT